MYNIAMKDFSELEKKLNIEFKNKDLLMQGFLHRSYLNENAGIKMAHNERLEFLGDAVLELVVTDYLYKEFPEKPEGELTAYRASLVNTNSISDASKRLGFEDYLLLSKGESKDTGKARAYILANTFEAFTGSLYLDQGYDAAQKFIEAHLFPELENIIKQNLWRDAKSFVQEKSQENEGVTPIYKVLSESGPDHDKVFTVGIFFRDHKVAEGKGSSKQEAETAAARKALEAKKWS
ncbi:MAG: ribonuclease ribonuclease [Patescibacteria group bacterium]|nr:ribonuclease ribonuclease [Patescibacteria group bacterium]